jgi:hypothetical protein
MSGKLDPTKKGWDTFKMPNGDFHVVPCLDLQEHTDDSDCACEPRRDFDCPNLYIHNAFDGREIVEKLEAGEDII